MASLLDSIAPAPSNADLRAVLWATVEQSVLIGDLYAQASPAAQDLALDCGWELSECAERLEDSDSASEEWVGASRAAIKRARGRLAELAPLG